MSSAVTDPRLFRLALAALGLVLALVFSATDAHHEGQSCGSLLSPQANPASNIAPGDGLSDGLANSGCEAARIERLPLVIVLGIGGLVALLAAVWPQKRPRGGSSNGPPGDGGNAAPQHALVGPGPGTVR
jgi:hypothetical protein